MPTPSASAPEHAPKRKRFNLAHSVAGVALLLALEGTAAIILDLIFPNGLPGIIVIMSVALPGGLGIVLAATEVIREVRRALRMLLLLSAVVLEFIIFFAFQYWYLSLTAPGSFQLLQMNPIDLMLHSTMVFALNPLYLPATPSAQLLLLINTLEALVLALFVLQNVWQFHNGSDNL